MPSSNCASGRTLLCGSGRRIACGRRRSLPGRNGHFLWRRRYGRWPRGRVNDGRCCLGWWPLWRLRQWRGWTRRFWTMHWWGQRRCLNLGDLGRRACGRCRGWLQDDRNRLRGWVGALWCASSRRWPWLSRLGTLWLGSGRSLWRCWFCAAHGSRCFRLERGQIGWADCSHWPGGPALQ